MTFDDRWTVRSAADGPAAVVSLLRRAADHLEALGPVVVRDLTLRREDDGLVLTTRFDRTQMAVDLDYLDPRMVAQFDAGKGERDDFDFVLAIASELEATTIVDLGCGTGQLAVELAVDGRRVIGVEPAPTMLDLARRRDGGEHVEWILGDGRAVPACRADLVVMTGNIALAIADDDLWEATVAAVTGTLRPGGRLVFSSMNPELRPWEQWTGDGLRLVGVTEGRVRIDWHGTLDDGESLVCGSEYRFRTLDELTASLTRHGLVVDRLYGDWKSNPFTSESGDIVFVARKP